MDLQSLEIYEGIFFGDGSSSQLKSIRVQERKEIEMIIYVLCRSWFKFVCVESSDVKGFNLHDELEALICAI